MVYDLCCDVGHRFEGWFGSSADFAAQKEADKLACPVCGSRAISKAPMAPAVARKGNQLTDCAKQQARQEQSDSTPDDRGEAPTPTGPAPTGPAPTDPTSVTGPSVNATPISNAALPPEVAKAMDKLAKAQARALKNSKWVGREFAEESRAMHYGEQDHAPIHGEASPDEAKSLLEEGIAVAPLPFPVASPDKLN